MRFTLVIIYMIILIKVAISNDRIINIITPKYNYSPGSITSLPITLVNKENETTEYEVAMTSMSEKIEIYLLNKEITINANNKETFLLPISISKDCPKGSHEIVLKVLNKVTKEFQIFYIEINVTANDEMTLSPLNNKEYISAGDTIHAHFMVKNKGNINQSIDLFSKNGFIIGSRNITLSPQEERLITVIKPTNPKDRHNYKQLIDLTIQRPVDILKNKLTANQYFNIIPINPLKIDKYKRWPVFLSINYLDMKQNGMKASGWQGELYTKGSFTNNDNHILEIKAISKNPAFYNSYGEFEQYYASYRSKKMHIHIGDKAYSSSYLTELSRFGRGVEFQYDLKGIKFGGFYNKPRFFNNIAEEFNAYSKVSINNKNSITLGYLQKKSNIEESNLNTTNNLPYIIYETELIKNTRVELEYALSKSRESNGSAYSFKSATQLSKLFATLNIIGASPNYAGYFKNTTNFNATINYMISSKLYLSFSHYRDVSQYERDTLLLAAPLRQNSLLSLNYQYSKKGQINLTIGNTASKDRLALNLFNYKENYIRASVNQKFGYFSANYNSHLGQTNNIITNHKGIFTLNTLRFSFDKNSTSAQIFGSLSNTARYNQAIISNKNKINLYYGARYSKIISRNTFFNLYYQNNYMPEEYFSDRNHFESSIKHIINSNHSLELTGRYMLQRGTIGHKDYIFNIRYNAQINIPVKKIKNLTSVQGHITSKDKEKIDGIRIQLGGQTSVTDKNGYFKFENITIGNHYFNIEKSQLTLNTIANIQLPAMLEINDSKINYQNIELTQEAQIVGHVTLHENASYNSINDKSKIDNSSIIIEASNGDQTIKKMTSLNVDYNFTYLRPGKWKIKIFSNGLSSNLEILKSEFDLNLNPNETKKLDIDINVKQKDIQFQKESIKVNIVKR